MMKYIMVSFLLILSNALAQPTNTETGQDVSGPATMGQPTYPSSGTTDAVANPDSLAEDAAVQKSDALAEPGTAAAQKQEEAKKFETGPYDKDGNYTIKIEEEAENPE